MQHNSAAVANGLLVQLKMKKSPGFVPQAGNEERDRIFKIPALGLKMVWPQIHSLGPDHTRQEFHKYRTIRRIGETLLMNDAPNLWP